MKKVLVLMMIALLAFMAVSCASEASAVSYDDAAASGSEVDKGGETSTDRTPIHECFSSDDTKNCLLDAAGPQILS